MLYCTLGNTGVVVSRIGFGASPLGDVFGITDPAEGVRAVHRALDSGINFFDVSPYYGATLAEQRLGTALSGVRNQAILATKCGRYGVDDFDFSARRVKASIDESLRRLRTDYVDLYQAHDIEFGDINQIVNETIPALKQVQQSGKARFIGITGYPLSMLRAAASRQRVDTVLSYCHYNLLVSDLDDSLAPFAKANRIGLINASPLHMGLLAGAEVPDWHPAPVNVRRAAAEAASLCRSRGCDPAVVALAYSVAHPYVSSTLIGMCTEREVLTSLKAVSFEIAPALLAELDRILEPVKNVNWPSGRPENTTALPLLA